MKRIVQRNISYIVAAILVFTATFLLYPHLSYIQDWTIFTNLSIIHPYSTPNFANPPWVFLFIPHAYLPSQISMSVNATLNVMVLAMANRKFGGGLLGLVLIFTSAQFMSLMASNTIDWVPLLGFMLPPSVGLVFISAKPQMLAGVGLIWLKKHEVRIFLPLAIVVLASLLIWWGWPLEWLRNSHKFCGYNLFPFLIPLGCYILWKAWKSDDEVLAAMSTCCFMPYFGVYSLVGLIALAGKKYLWIAVALWLGGWICILAKSLI